MKGTILGLGAISGEDGVRYSFKIDSIANLGNKNPDNLAGTQVDFIINGNEAKNIFIVSGNIGNLKDQLMAHDTPGIRFKMLFVSGCILLGWIPFFGQVAGIIGLIFFILALIDMQRASGSTSLIAKFICIIAIGVVTALFAMIFGGSALWGMIMGKGYALGFGLIAALIVGIIGAIAVFSFMILFARELAFITKQKFFLWETYLRIAGFVFILIPFVGWVLGPIFILASLVLFIIGSYKIQEIQKRTNTDFMPWF